ncbi:MAG: anthranilate synthase component I family protein [Acidimicrobiia bacterium]
MRATAPIRPASVLRHLPSRRGFAVVRDGSSTVIASAPDAVRTANGASAFDVLQEVDDGGFWIGFCAYDLGRSIERIRPSTPDDLHVPDVAFARYDARLVMHDDGELELTGDRAGRGRLAAAVRAAERDRSEWATPMLGSWTSSLDRVDHAQACAQVLELLRAGECYQVNVTRRLTASGLTDPISLYDTLASANPAPHSSLCTFGTDAGVDIDVVSASPELFFRIEPSAAGRRIETRPIKGTAADISTLAASAKDHAENVMIVDLARNDLGRVCEFGSVRVPQLCAIERHPGLYHLVSTVTGMLRPDVGLADVVRATFPPASVTGAPKPRVMQAIEDLEPVRRGVYCGAVGWVDGDAGRVELSVAIRTFTITGTPHDRRTHLGVGGGIVADSHPDDEWAETELKAARLLAAVGSTTKPVAASGAPTR